MWSILRQCNSFGIMLNQISVTPCKKRPRDASAVVVTVGNNDVLLVDPKMLGLLHHLLLCLSSVANSSGPTTT